MSPVPAVVLDRLQLTWPDGRVALADVSGAFGPGRTGLIGRNGSGKTTLLRLIAGNLVPTGGRVTTIGDVALLPQRLTPDPDLPVEDLLGVGGVLRAVRAVESGDTSPDLFEIIGADWDLEARTTAALAEAGLPADALGRRVGALSGGEAVLAALVGIRMRAAPVTLLDEPTNNLDREARTRLFALVRSWRGALVIASHDTALLELMDETAELYGNALTTFGGPYSAWRLARDAEQEAAVQAERAATQAERREKRQRITAETTLAHRRAVGAKASAEKREPKIIMNARKGEAQVSAGQLRTEMRQKEAEARAAREEAGRRIRSDDVVHVDLPDPAVAASRRLATLRDTEHAWEIRGPERVALVGRNGAGKSTLLDRLVASAASGGDGPATIDAVAHTERIGYLRQGRDGLDETASAVVNVAAAAPHVPLPDLRNRLARFLLRGPTADLPVAGLSGGERFRVALARLLLADPPAQLLVLDEPTNDLDLDTVDALVSALAAYRGGVLVVSHDDAFLDRVGIDLRLELEDGGLRAV